MDLSIIIPAYNEEESVQELAGWILKVTEQHKLSCEIVFVDDGSRDGTWSSIERLAAQDDRVRGIRFGRNYGKSAALNKGFEAAQGDVVITMDADLQDSPDEIPDLCRMIRKEGYDLVSGWKKKRHDPLGKTIPSKFFNWTTRRLSGIKLHDFNCGLKAYRKDLVKSIEVYGEMHRYIPVLAKWAGFTRIGEKIVQHRRRKFGKSKYGWERLIKGYLDLLSITFISRFGKRPMHFFGTLGTLIFLAGFVIAAWLAYARFFMAGYRMTERPLFYFGILAMILGTQLFLAGFLAEMISRSSPDKNHYIVKQTIGFPGDTAL